jgi:hypothetical protein
MYDDDDEDAWSAYYPDLVAEQAAEDHDIHPFFDRLSWQEGFARGYQSGREDGEHLERESLRAALLSALHVMAGDLYLRLRHDLETPLDVVHAVARMIEDRQTTADT